MKVKRTVLVTIALAMTVALSGCGEKVPDMTEEEYAQVVEFAVGLLMKYSNNDQEKLTYVDAKEVQKEREKEAKLAAQAEEKLKEEKPKEEKKPEPARVEKTEEPKETEAIAEASEEKPSEAASEASDLIAEAKTEDEEKEPSAVGSDVASTEATQEPEEETTETPSGDGITLSSDETQEIANDLFLSYQGYSISRTYPESSKSYVVNADKGKKLLVLRFDLYNASGSTKSVNMINQNLLFQILLNGKNIGYSSVTFLPNDLSSYIGQVESKAHESLVVLTQISESEAKSVETLGMIVSMNGEKQEVNME